MVPLDQNYVSIVPHIENLVVHLPSLSHVLEHSDHCVHSVSLQSTGQGTSQEEVVNGGGDTANCTINRKEKCD